MTRNIKLVGAIGLNDRVNHIKSDLENVLQDLFEDVEFCNKRKLNFVHLYLLTRKCRKFPSVGNFPGHFSSSVQNNPAQWSHVTILDHQV